MSWTCIHRQCWSNGLPDIPQWYATTQYRYRDDVFRYGPQRLDTILLYRKRRRCKGNWSAQSTQSCATTLAAGSTGDTQAPTIPGSVTATAASLSQINLSWSASSDNTRVTGYRIYCNGTQITNTLTGTTYSDAGLSASTQYCYTVSASDAAGNWSTQSIQSCATTLADSQAPTVPGSVTATAVSSSQINLSWSASADNTGVTGYRLYKGGVFLKQVAGTSTTDTGLSALTQYCYTVSAGMLQGTGRPRAPRGPSPAPPLLK